MEHRTDLSADDLDRPDWNSLLANYSKHDIGEAYFTGRVEQIGLQAEHWGIDKRHHDEHLIFDNAMDLRLWEPLDGQDTAPQIDEQLSHPTYQFDQRVVRGINPFFDNDDYEQSTTVEMESWELRAIADVKTKSSPSWLGKFNLRHLAHYAEWADTYDVPVFIYMTMVDDEAERVGEEDFITPVPSDWDWPHLIDHYDGDMNHSYGDMKDFARTCPIVKRTFRAPDGNLVVNIEDEHRYNWDWFVEHVL